MTEKSVTPANEDSGSGATWLDRFLKNIGEHWFGYIVAALVFLIALFIGVRLATPLMAMNYYSQVFQFVKITFRFPDLIAGAIAVWLVAVGMCLVPIALSWVFVRRSRPVLFSGAAVISLAMLGAYLLSQPRQGEYFNYYTGESVFMFSKEGGRIEMFPLGYVFHPRYGSPLKRMDSQTAREFEKQTKDDEETIRKNLQLEKEKIPTPATREVKQIVRHREIVNPLVPLNITSYPQLVETETRMQTNWLGQQTGIMVYTFCSFKLPSQHSDLYFAPLSLMVDYVRQNQEKTVVGVVVSSLSHITVDTLLHEFSFENHATYLMDDRGIMYFPTVDKGDYPLKMAGTADCMIHCNAPRAMLVKPGRIYRVEIEFPPLPKYKPQIYLQVQHFPRLALNVF